MYADYAKMKGVELHKSDHRMFESLMDRVLRESNLTKKKELYNTFRAEISKHAFAEEEVRGYYNIW